MVVKPAGGKYVALVANEIAAIYPSADERQEYVMVLSPPLEAVVLPMVDAGVPPLHIVSPVLAIVPVVNAERTVTVHVPVETVGVVLHVPSLAYRL